MRVAKLSAEQQKQLADLERIRDSDDGDDETVVWVRNSDGHETRLSGARAERWLERNGYSEADAAKGAALPEKKPDPAKKTPDKKTPDAPDEGAELAPDAPAGGAAKAPRKFF